MNLQLPRDELPAEEWLSIKSIIRDLVLEDHDWAADPPRRVLSPPFISVLRDLRASPSPSGRQVVKRLALPSSVPGKTEPVCFHSSIGPFLKKQFRLINILSSFASEPGVRSVMFDPFFNSGNVIYINA